HVDALGGVPGPLGGGALALRSGRRQVDAAEVGDLEAHRSDSLVEARSLVAGVPSEACARRSTSSTSTPTWTYSVTPAASSASRRSPGRPARYRCASPASRSAVANSTARSAYTSSEEHRQASCTRASATSATASAGSS